MSQIAKRYPYQDEAGKLLYEQVRFDPKDFRFRRPDGTGGWIWNLQGVKKVLYHLPEVLAGDEVVITEGEKDADLLHSWGLVSTCNPGGAGKWTDEYSQVLTGKKVVVLQDDDEPGRKHAEQVAASVAQYAAEVKLMPPFQAAKDVSEWAEKGGTDDELERIVAGTKPF